MSLEGVNATDARTLNPTLQLDDPLLAKQAEIQANLMDRTDEVAREAIEQTEAPATTDKIEAEVTVNPEGTEEISAAAVKAGLIGAIAMIADPEPADVARELDEICQEELKAAEEKQDAPRLNYFTQMSRFIAALSTLLQDWKSVDSHRSEEKKAKYAKASTDIELNHYTKGDWNLLLGVVGTAIGLYPKTQNLAGPFSSLVQSLNSRLDANATKPSQENQMTLQDINASRDSGASTDAMRDQVLAVLREMREYEAAAVRG